MQENPRIPIVCMIKGIYPDFPQKIQLSTESNDQFLMVKAPFINSHVKASIY